jgi:hypothetical protein
MNNISLLVGLKNNLNYNKHFYSTTRELYPEVEICFVSYGSTDGTHEWLDSLQDNNVKYFHSAAHAMERVFGYLGTQSNLLVV